MARPSYNGFYLFDSYDPSNDTWYTEGNLLPGAFSGIRQTIHPNGAAGNAYVGHGFADRQWKYQGLISGPLYHVLNQLADIESYIAEATNDPTTYHDLVDTYDRSWGDSQITTCTVVEGPRRCFGNDHWIASVVVEGIIRAMPNEVGG